MELVLGVAVLVAVVALATSLALRVSLRRARADAARDAALARAEAAALAARLAELERGAATALGGVEESAYLITDAGAEPTATPAGDRLVLSTTLGEPVVKAAALAHGLRRALSPAARNRIRFEMRREVRRSRKVRRREMREAWRKSRSGDPDSTDGAPESSAA